MINPHYIFCAVLSERNPAKRDQSKCNCGIDQQSDIGLFVCLAAVRQ